MVAQIFRRSSLDQGFRSDYGVGMENKNEALKALIEEVGGATQLAAVCGVTEGAVRHWQREGRVSNLAARLLAHLYPKHSIEQLTNKDKAEE